MAGTVQGPLTDLERANYTSDSDLVKSITYTRQDGEIVIDDSTPIDVNIASPDPLPVSNAVYPVIPNEKRVYRRKELVDDTYDEDMNNDCSTGNFDFEYRPDDGDGEVLLYSLRMTIIDENISNLFNFGNMGELSNGFQIITIVDGDFGTYGTFKNNRDVYLNAVNQLQVNQSFVNATNDTVLILQLDFPAPVRLNNDGGGNDRIFVRCRDDQTQIRDMRGIVFISQLVVP